MLRIGVTIGLIQNLNNLPPQLGHVVHCRVPDNRPVDGKVGVDGYVAEADYVRPGHIWKSVAKRSGKAGGRFTNDDELLEDSALPQLILEKCLLVNVAYKTLYRVGRFNNIAQV